MHYYFGYQPLGIEDFAELYDIQADPDELHDLKGTYPDIAEELLAETKAKLQEVDRPYLSNG